MIIKEIINWFELLEREPDNYQLRTHKQIITNKFKLLLRTNTQGVKEDCLVVGTIDISPELQNKGLFKSFIKCLADINKWDKIVFEDVENEYLKDWFKRNKFEVVGNGYDTSYIIYNKELDRYSSNKFLETEKLFRLE